MDIYDYDPDDHKQILKTRLVGDVNPSVTMSTEDSNSVAQKFNTNHLIQSIENAVNHKSTDIVQKEKEK